MIITSQKRPYDVNGFENILLRKTDLQTAKAAEIQPVHEIGGEVGRKGNA